MFPAHIYRQRREALRKKMESGILLFLGNEESPMNYEANVYPFRQDSSFLYYWGIDLPRLAAVIDVDKNQEILFGDDYSIHDIVWVGAQPGKKELAEKIGVKIVKPTAQLGDYLTQALERGRRIHFLPQYRPENKLKLQEFLGIRAGFVNRYASHEMVKAVVHQRSVKSREEVEQLEIALDITRELHIQAMKLTRPGLYEREVAGQLEGIAKQQGVQLSFPLIFSVHGETLHNNYYGNKMTAGRLVVNDCGAESPLHYAGDITRTFPVSGKFTEQQKAVYNIVLQAQLQAIEAIAPGVKYRDIHLLAARVIASGLKELGLMKGDVEEAVEKGAHALFFPHGLGHMLGLDVHDMENLGENYVGYDERVKRSKQFGLGYLRLAKELKPGFVLTVEPGIYFIPQLIDIWQSEKKFEEFINYQQLESFRDFGGIRIEDNVLVTENGHRVLGKPIPKEVKEVEETMAAR